ncbi:MAG: ABC transporter ATP-binding protein [Paracoccaceae bacterium]|nr:MAG: ABC transporter ATP-binding protein [Paracoccaceae bacterium]
MPEPLLAVERLDARYGDFQALHGVSLRLEEGEALAVIGANGAGKTTLLRAIAGLLPRRADAVRLRGRPIGGLRADQVARLGIAMVPEGRQLFPSLDVEENLLIGGQLGRPGPWSLQAVYALFPVLAERRRQKATSLSGGQQQMVAIGRALMANPEVILFDEISLGLAPIVIRDIYAALPGILASGLSAVDRRAGHRPGAGGHPALLLPAGGAGLARRTVAGRLARGDRARLFRGRVTWTG